VTTIFRPTNRESSIDFSQEVVLPLSAKLLLAPPQL
jgi:hypothetical protein